MALTQYQIFCRYFNSSVNKVVTNKTSCLWISDDEYCAIEAIYTDVEQKAEYDKLVQSIKDGTKKIKDFNLAEKQLYDNCKLYEDFNKNQSKGMSSLEIVKVEPADSLYQDTTGSKRKEKMQRDLAMYDIIVNESKASNPKYDMIFMYNGLGKKDGAVADYNPPVQDKKQVPYVYYDKMKRLDFDPWFFHSSHASLISAMNKAKELVNILGKESVKIGKVVPLDKYIEIV